MNAAFINDVVDFFAAADPVAQMAINEFLEISDMLTEWVLDHFSSTEKSFLAAKLDDPSLSFASSVAEKKASEIVVILTRR